MTKTAWHEGDAIDEGVILVQVDSRGPDDLKDSGGFRREGFSYPNAVSGLVLTCLCHAGHKHVCRTDPKVKRLLMRFERIQRRHYAMKLMAYTMINVRHFCGA
jgi:hypothetical protein